LRRKNIVELEDRRFSSKISANYRCLPGFPDQNVVNQSGLGIEPIAKDGRSWHSKMNVAFATAWLTYTTDQQHAT